MKWYHTFILLPLAVDPEIWDLSYRDPRRPDATREAIPVKWLPGCRYGVVTKNVDGKDRIIWFDADAVAIEGHSSLTGGGTVTFDLSKGQGAPLTNEQLGDLELNP